MVSKLCLNTLEIWLPESQPRFFISLYKFKIQHLKVPPPCIRELSWFRMLAPRSPRTVRHVERGSPSSPGRPAGSPAPGTPAVRSCTGGSVSGPRREETGPSATDPCSEGVSHPGCRACGCRGAGWGPKPKDPGSSLSRAAAQSAFQVSDLGVECVVAWDSGENSMKHRAGRQLIRTL